MGIIAKLAGLYEGSRTTKDHTKWRDVSDENKISEDRLKLVMFWLAVVCFLGAAVTAACYGLNQINMEVTLGVSIPVTVLGFVLWGIGFSQNFEQSTYPVTYIADSEKMVGGGRVVGGAPYNSADYVYDLSMTTPGLCVYEDAAACRTAINSLEAANEVALLHDFCSPITFNSHYPYYPPPALDLRQQIRAKINYYTRNRNMGPLVRGGYLGPKEANEINDLLDRYAERLKNKNEALKKKDQDHAEKVRLKEQDRAGKIEAQESLRKRYPAGTDMGVKASEGGSDAMSWQELGTEIETIDKEKAQIQRDVAAEKAEIERAFQGDKDAMDKEWMEIRSRIFVGMRRVVAKPSASAAATAAAGPAISTSGTPAASASSVSPLAPASSPPLSTAAPGASSVSAPAASAAAPAASA